MTIEQRRESRNAARTPFMWSSFYLKPTLDQEWPGWQTEIIAAVNERAEERLLAPRHSSSRQDEEVRTWKVGGWAVQKYLPTLDRLYRGRCRELAQQATRQILAAGEDPAHSITINVQRGEEPYESHVDTNPAEGLLYCTSHAQGEGGELVISSDPDADSIEEIEASDPTIIRPVAGLFVVFDGRIYPHRVRPLCNNKDGKSQRIVAAMNYYTTSTTEKDRPEDLDAFLEKGREWRNGKVASRGPASRADKLQ